MRKYIHLAVEDRKFIAAAFGCTEQSVFNALNFDPKRGNSDLAKRIRKLAFQRGGFEMEAPTEELETLFDHDGTISQYMPNGAKIELSKIDCSGVIWFKGQKVWESSHVTLNQIESIQQRAMTIR